MDFIVKCKLLFRDSQIPQLATDGSSGHDVYVYRVLDKKTKKVISDLKEPAEIKPGESMLFGIGVCFEVPYTHHALMCARSGIDCQYDVDVGHPTAPLDPDYRGEWTVFLRNHSEESFVVKKHMRIAQIVFYRREIPLIVEAKKLSKTKRGKGGLGSTGLY